MKNWLPRLLIIAVVLISLAYFIIPGKLIVSTVSLVRVNPHGAYRCLTDENTWRQIFGKEVAKNTFAFNKIAFIIDRKLADGVEILIEDDGVTDSSLIELATLNNDSSMIRWTVATETSSNPLKKIGQYFGTGTIRNTLASALDTMKRFLENEENVYGINVSRTTVKDTILIATKKRFKSYPSARDIYSLIRALQNYARLNDASESGYPMLDIKKLDSANFEAMAALPINKELQDKGEILHKEMVAGNILVTEVKGGPYTVSKAFHSLGNYVADHDLQSPAIPFQSLITNRLQQPDTTKWITKIYYPIY